MRPAARGLTETDAVGLLDERQPLLHGRPQGGVDDAEVCVHLANPLLRRPGERAAAPGIGVFDEPPLVPDPDAGILLVP
jgi:hypothetical protein